VGAREKMNIDLMSKITQKIQSSKALTLKRNVFNTAQNTLKVILLQSIKTFKQSAATTSLLLAMSIPGTLAASSESLPTTGAAPEYYKEIAERYFDLYTNKPGVRGDYVYVEQWADYNSALKGNGFKMIPMGLDWGYEVNGKQYNVRDPGGFSDLNDAQKMAVFAACMSEKNGGLKACDSTAPNPDELKKADIKSKHGIYEDAGGVALKLFNYAMGGVNNTGSDCITCTFLGNFMLGLAAFSEATFYYMQSAFLLIVPVLMLIWIGVRTIQLFYSGGEDGRSYLYSISTKMALFFIVWAVISIGGSTDPNRSSSTGSSHEPPYAWLTTGPTYLEFAFSISSEIRNHTLKMHSKVTNLEVSKEDDAFRCKDTVEFMSTFTDKGYMASFTGAALDVACATERTHMVGFASGIAVIFAAVEQTELWKWKSYGYMIVQMVCGFFLLFVFGLSAIWFTFLVLDVVVRGLITAAFAPLIAATLLFAPTRYIASSAFKSLAGAVITAISIGIVSTLAFFLLTNTVSVYNSLVTDLDSSYAAHKLTPVTKTTAIDNCGKEFTTGCAFREFIVRIQEDKSSETRIPMDLTAPWFYYLILSGLAIFALGKKIISMLEGMIGVQGASTMADNAMKLSRTSMSLGMMGAGVAAVASKGGLRLAGATGSYATGAIGGAMAAKKIAGNINPFPNSIAETANHLAEGADATNEQ
jgi:hypothetical protein